MTFTPPNLQQQIPGVLADPPRWTIPAGGMYANPDPALHALNIVRALKLEDFIRFRNCLNALLENEEMA